MCILGALQCSGNSKVAGSDWQSRERPSAEKAVWEYGMPTTLIVKGLADQVVVAMTSPIIRRRGKESMDMVVSGEMNGMDYCLLAGYQNLYHLGLSCWNHISRIITTRQSIHQTIEMRDILDCGTPSLKPDGLNAPIQNFRGGGCKRNSKSCSRRDVWKVKANCITALALNSTKYSIN